jgi:hypothetical protein
MVEQDGYAEVARLARRMSAFLAVAMYRVYVTSDHLFRCPCVVVDWLLSHRRFSWGTTTGWTGAARTRKCGCVSLGTPAMADMVAGLEDPGSLR